jgi:cytochrome oxidase assembly protein ShyY1
MASATPERDAGRLPPWPSGIARCGPRAGPASAEPDTVDHVLRRVIGLTVFTAVLATAFILLGRWQLSRLDERRVDNAQVTAARDVAAVPLGILAEPGMPLDPALEWRRATAIGRYDAEATVLVRNRSYQGANGLLVVVPLVTASGDALLVNRGWIPPAPTATGRPDVPPPPSGEVAVEVRLHPAERPRPAQDLPAGQVLSIDTAGLADAVEAPLYGGYGDLVQERPAADPAPALPEPPVVDEGPHLGYAIQWFCFAVIAAVGYVILLTRGLPERDPLPAPPATAPPAAGPPA